MQCRKFLLVFHNVFHGTVAESASQIYALVPLGHHSRKLSLDNENQWASIKVELKINIFIEIIMEYKHLILEFLHLIFMNCKFKINNYHLFLRTFILTKLFFLSFDGSYCSSSSSLGICFDISQNSLLPNLKSPCCCALYQNI